MIIKIVKEYERLVVFRLGRFHKVKGPGIVMLLAFIDKAVKVDLREQFLEIPHQTCITKDNAPIDIDFIIYWKVVKPELSVIQVKDFAGASQGIATTTLRAIIGDMMLDDTLVKREQINQILCTKLDEVTERWGVRVTNVEIREIKPPRGIQEAMNRQMAAERTRRAVITEAEGEREAKIKIAEGEKQSAILRAEGQKEAEILKAEGERQASISRAEGFSSALDKISKVAKTVDDKTMTLQYFDMLKELGHSSSTKYIFPLEFIKLIQPFVNLINKTEKIKHSNLNK